MIKYIFIGFFLASFFLFYYSYCYVLSKDFDAKKYEPRLIALAKKSIITKDIPVASLLIYQGKIIGEGQNDVLKNNNPSGHAEINAIANCFKNIGYEKFSKLKKRHLMLLTTYEPCPMCKGAIQEYGIKNVVFSFAKSNEDKFWYFKNDLKYYINLKQMKNKRLQYDLFKMHPDFDSIVNPY